MERMHPAIVVVEGYYEGVGQVVAFRAGDGRA
jgi:hypothetical protein